MIESKHDCLSIDDLDRFVGVELEKHITRFAKNRGNGLDTVSLKYLASNIKDLTQIEPIHFYWPFEEPFSRERLHQCDLSQGLPLKLFVGYRRYQAILRAFADLTGEERTRPLVHVRIYERPTLVDFLVKERATFRDRNARTLNVSSSGQVETAIDCLLLRLATSSNAFLIATQPLDRLICYNAIYQDLQNIIPDDFSHRDMLRYLGVHEQDTRYRMSLRFFYLVQHPDLYKATLDRYLKLSTAEYAAEKLHADRTRVITFLSTLFEYVTEIQKLEGKNSLKRPPSDWRYYNNRVVMSWVREIAVHKAVLTRWTPVKFPQDESDELLYYGTNNLTEDRYKMKVSSKKGLGSGFNLSGVNLELSTTDEPKIRFMVDLHFKLNELSNNLFGWIGGVKPKTRGGHLKVERVVGLNGVDYDSKYLDYVYQNRLERFINIRGARLAVQQAIRNKSIHYPNDPIRPEEEERFQINPEGFRDRIVGYLVDCHDRMAKRRKVEREMTADEFRKNRTANETIAKMMHGFINDLRDYENTAAKNGNESGSPDADAKTGKHLEDILKNSAALSAFKKLLDETMAAKTEYFRTVEKLEQLAYTNSMFAQLNEQNGNGNGNGNGHHQSNGTATIPTLIMPGTPGWKP